MNRMAIARNINRALRIDKMSQRELAEKLGLTEVTVSRYCTGQRIPSSYALLRMARLFHTTMEDLMTGVEDEIKEPTSTDRTERESISYLEGFREGARLAVAAGASNAQVAFEEMKDMHIRQFGGNDG